MNIPLELAYKSPELFKNPRQDLHGYSRTLSTRPGPRAISKRMLIVDDEQEITEILSDFLSVNLECETAGSAEEALARLRQREFRLVISDITMPGMSGLEMVPHVKQISPDAVVIILSGLQTVETAIEAMRLGAFDYVMKPFELCQIEAVVKRALTHHELMVSRQRYENRLEKLVETRTAELDQALASLKNASPSTLKPPTPAREKRESENHGHPERVVTYSLRLGSEYGLDSQLMKALEFGWFLHDAGMIGLPDAILSKPAQLTEEGWLGKREWVVGQQRQKWDGSEYLPGLRGEDIDLCAHIFAVADAFDAITSNYGCRRGKSYEAAAEELDQCAGKLFDATVVAAFHRVPKEDWAELDLRSRSEFRAPLSAQPKA